MNKEYTENQLEELTVSELIDLADDDCRAAHIVGRRFHYGIEVDEDYEIALAYYTIAANQNYSKSLNNIGTMYNEGEYLPKNEAVAEIYFKKAVENGSVVAIYNLAQQAFDTTDESHDQSDFERGIKLLEEAIELGDESSVILLAEKYMNNHVIQRDFNKSIKLLDSIPNNPKALNMLGNIYYNEEVISQDFKKAFNYYKKSADLDYVHGQKNVAECYELGEGVEQNIKNALKYFELASKQDCKYSLRKFNELSEKGEKL